MAEPFSKSNVARAAGAREQLKLVRLPKFPLDLYVQPGGALLLIGKNVIDSPSPSGHSTGAPGT